MTPQTSHYIEFTQYTEMANGERTPPIKRRIHSSRRCGNCAHDGSRDSEWCADGGVEEFGRCMNLCSAADDEHEAHQWCSAHQTQAEFDAWIHRIERPVFTLVPKD